MLVVGAILPEMSGSCAELASISLSKGKQGGSEVR